MTRVTPSKYRFLCFSSSVVKNASGHIPISFSNNKINNSVPTYIIHLTVGRAINDICRLVTLSLHKWADLSSTVHIENLTAHISNFFHLGKYQNKYENLDTQVLKYKEF